MSTFTHVSPQGAYMGSPSGMMVEGKRMDRPLEVAIQSARVSLSPTNRMVNVEASLTDHDVYRLFEELPPDAREEFALRALKVGALAVRDAATVSKADYVGREFDRMQRELAVQFDSFFGENGRLRQELDREFGPEAGRVFRLVLNPDDTRTPIGRFKKSLEDRFDPGREGSPLWQLKQDWQAQFQQLRVDLGVKNAVAAERLKGTQKGIPFQDSVLNFLLGIAASHGDRVEDTSALSGPLGDVGDAVCTIDTASTGGLARRIVVESKFKKDLTYRGKESIHKELDEAMKNREAHFAIAAVQKQYATKFAPLRYVAPSQILVAVDEAEDNPLPLKVAYELARSLVITKAGQREARLDVEGVLAGLAQINSQLENAQAMKTGLTGASNNIKGVRDLVEAMEENIKRTVKELIRAVQASEKPRS